MCTEKVFRLSNSEYAVDVGIFCEGPVVFSFDNMVSAGPLENRRGWSFEFLSRNKINVIAFLESERKRWYRRESFIDLIERLGQEVDISSFSRRISYGASMGGYAAGAFSRLLKCESALLIEPISTLNQDVVPWEDRFSVAFGENWIDSYHDAAEEARNIKDLCIVADPLNYRDRSHVHRFAERNKSLMFYGVPGVGHGMAERLSEMGILKDMALDFFRNNSVTSDIFYRRARKRRCCAAYYRWMLSPSNRYLRKRYAEVVAFHYLIFLLGKGLNKEQIMKELGFSLSHVLPEYSNVLLRSVLFMNPNAHRASKVLAQLETVSSYDAGEV